MTVVRTLVIGGTIHGRPAAELVRLANRFQSRVMLVVADRDVDAKSVIGIMSLAIRPGTTVRVITTGSDEKAAADAVVQLLQAFPAVE